MADVCESHLERMGKELKCPICLSLLNSAVSLTCNHVFCNTCIEKSMKSASDCPVCKVPYRRREIRPAPHMDNLVSVYKSMEVASGVNIHATQNSVSTKILGENNQTDNIYVVLSNGEAHLDNLEDENHKQCQRKGLKRASMTNQRPFVSNLVTPAFPGKKRIQVNPSLETQMQPGELDIRIGGTGRNQPEIDTVSQKNMSFIREKREHNFSPFFWLKEEVDLEKSSQETDGDQDMYTPPERPCFSDIKESDDDVPCKISPKRGTDIVSNSLNFIDSEMFEWTQRPCSPELCSNSLAMQIEDTAEHHEAEQNGEAAMTQTTKGLNISPKKREGICKRIGKTSGNKCRVKLSNGEVSDAIETRQRQKTKKTLSEVTTVNVQPEKVTNQDMLENSSNKGNMLRRKRKNSRNNIVISESIIHEAAENKSTLSDGTENLSNNNKTAFIDLSAPQGLKNSSKGSSMLKRSSNNTKRMNTRREKLGGKVKAGKCEAVNDLVNEKQGNEVLMSHSNNNMLPLGTDNEVSDRGMTSKTCEVNSKRMLKSLKKVKFYIEGMSKGDCGGFPISDDAEATVTGQTFQRIQATKGQTGTKVPETKDKATPTLSCTVLRKCKTLPSSIHCAFCQSSGESEASGVMVHYLEGKLVTDSDNAKSNAVHVHKNCTEWAPNVYFDDEDVINLEDELSRSRRIGCSCCGKKGAALGCYEKSCRKSFHVPCARLNPGCRWDYENFVMLCPIHASCQLPNEITKSQCTQKRKHAAEIKSHNHQVKAANESKSVSVSPWKSQKRLKNLVLCCSALTNTEKDIVFEFEKLSGVTIMKNWDSSATHIIAATDENGACRRTLKFLMGVLEGKWILNVMWLKACMEAGELVDEQSYEILVDIHGIRDGPRLGRLRLLHKQAKLFDGYTFFFMGDFAPSYKGYLHDLVIAAGGRILNRKPVGGDQAIASTTFIIYSLELPEKYTLSNANSLLNNRRIDAEAVASSTGSLVASNSWTLNSIAGYKLQDCAE